MWFSLLKKFLLGEKGVNLSGGQKSRISLARAIYSNKDIYLFDDPLSAVDAHVGRYILEKCFLKYLRNKTRILVTHNLECLKFVDTVVIMSKGEIAATGAYEYIKELPIFLEILEKSKKKQKEEEHEEIKDEIIIPEVQSEEVEEENDFGIVLEQTGTLLGPKTPPSASPMGVNYLKPGPPPPALRIPTMPEYLL